MHDAQALAGYTFLVVEDAPVQAHMISDLLHSMGGTVGWTAYTYAQARDALGDVQFDCAILGVNLGGTLSFRIADLLRIRGKPFIFCTANADAVDVYPGAVETLRLDKLVNEDQLRDMVLRALSVGG